MKRNIGIYLVLILWLILIFRVGANVVRLVKAGNRVTEAKLELAEAKRKNEELKQNLALVQTPEFMERQAREKLGYGMPGEIEIIMPEQNNAHPTSPQASLGAGEPNWVQWRKLYLGW